MKRPTYGEILEAVQGSRGDFQVIADRLGTDAETAEAVVLQMDITAEAFQAEQEQAEIS